MKCALFLTLFFSFLAGEESSRIKKSAFELVQRGDKKKKEGDILRALELYEQSYNLYPNSFTAIRLSSVLALLHREEELIALLEKEEETKKIPKAELLLARSKKNCGNVREAIGHYIAYAKSKKARLGPKFELIELLIEEEETKEATQFLEEIKNEPMHPSQKRKFHLLSTQIALKEGREVEALLEDPQLRREVLLFSGAYEEAKELSPHALLFLAEGEREGAFDNLQKAEKEILLLPNSNKRTLLTVHYLQAKELLTGDKALLTVAEKLLKSLPEELPKVRFFRARETRSDLLHYQGPFAGEILLNGGRAHLARSIRTYSEKEAEKAFALFAALYERKISDRFSKAAVEGALQAFFLLSDKEIALRTLTSWRGGEPFTHLAVGKALLATKHFARAEAELQKAGGKEGELLLAHLLFAKGAYLPAKSALLSWCESYGESSEALLALAEVEEALGFDGRPFK